MCFIVLFLWECIEQYKGMNGFLPKDIPSTGQFTPGESRQAVVSRPRSISFQQASHSVVAASEARQPQSWRFSLPFSVAM